MSASLREILLPLQEVTLTNLAEELRKKDTLAAALGVAARNFESLGQLETLVILREPSNSKPILAGPSERVASQIMANRCQ